MNIGLFDEIKLRASSPRSEEYRVGYQAALKDCLEFFRLWEALSSDLIDIKKQQFEKFKETLEEASSED